MNTLASPRPRRETFTERELSKAGLIAFFNIAKAWKLSTEEERRLLGEPSRSTLFNWRKDPDVELGRDILDRISYVLGIWKALRILIPDDRQAALWVKKSNLDPFFNGKTPLDRMQLSLVDLADVRRYLDGRRGGG